MKRKVQAQRKFAQGAYIPPSPAPPVPMERRPDVTPCKDENKNIFYNNISAVDMLNLVAFQNLHSHSEPVVLLERLHQSQDRLREQATRAELAAAPHRHKPRASVARAPPVGVAAPAFKKSRPIRKRVRAKRGASPVSEDDQPLNLVAQTLQRALSPPRTKRKGPAKSPLRDPQMRPSRPPRRPIRLPKSLRRPTTTDNQRQNDTFTLQLRLDRPRLNLLSPDWRLRKYNYSSRHSPRPQRSNDRIAQPVRRLSPRPKRRSRSSDSIATFQSVESSTISRSTTSWAPGVRRSIKVKRARKNVPAKKTTPLGKRGPWKAGTRSAVQRSSAKQSSAKKQKTLAGEAIPAVQEHDSERKEPPTNGEAINSIDLIARCEGWLLSCNANPPEDVEHDRINFKVPRVPARKKELVKARPTETTPTLSANVPVSSKSIQPRPTPSTSQKVESVVAIKPNNKPLALANTTPKGPDRSRITRSFVPNTRESKKQVCPSRLFKTVRSIVNANDNDLATRCNVCKYCCRVDKILRLSHLVHKAAPADVPTEAVDVYDFSSEQEEAPQLLNYRQNRKLRSDVPLAKSPPAGESHALVKVPTKRPLKPVVVPPITPNSQAPALATTSKTVPASQGPVIVVTENIQVAPPLSTSLRSSQRPISLLTPKHHILPPKPSVNLSAGKYLIAENGLNMSESNSSRQSLAATRTTIPPDASQLKVPSPVWDHRLSSSESTSGPQHAWLSGPWQVQAHTLAPDAVKASPDPVQASPDPVQASPDPVQASPDPVQAIPDPVQASPDPVQASPGTSNSTKESLEQIMQRLKTPIYLDLFAPEYPRIIEITTIALDTNPTKPILQARLVSRESATVQNEFSLLEHGNLLDELLSTLTRLFDAEAEKIMKTRNDLLELARRAVLNKARGHSNATNNDSAEARKDGAEGKTDARDKPNVVINETSMQTITEENPQGKEPPCLPEEPPLPPKDLRSQPKSGRIEVLADVHCEKEKPPAEPSTSKRAGDNKKTLSAPLDIFREAPSFYPTEEEFVDPIAYFEKIYEVAESYGVCKVVAPASFRPSCIKTDDVRFVVANQYIARLYNRWGQATREMCAIKAYLAEQKVFFSRPPLIDGIELNLPKLYRTVQRYGGLKKVIEKKRWAKVAEDMRFPRGPRSASRIDRLYVKHLLPYDTLSNDERSELMQKVEKSWMRSYEHMLARASNPLHRQKRLLGESDSSEEADTDEDPNLASAIAEAEDCVVSGRSVKLSVFQKVADNAVNTLFGQPEQATPEAVEQQYWELVANGNEHVCVNSASIDTGEGYGFSSSKLDPNSRHPWNLKMLSHNEGNVLRSLGPVLGVTVPTLHLGMIYSTSCWHRDPHRLPWIEYMHRGPAKIWYGMADDQGEQFRKAVEEICPTSCQNKSMWLPSDITMIPPDMLQANNISLSRVVQKPGEFIIVLPKAYSSSISTGYTESESAYFATSAWLDEVESVFKELRLNCEPTMFSLEQLLLALAQDESASPALLRRVQPALAAAVAGELAHRARLRQLGVSFSPPEYPPGWSRKKRPGGAWNVREQDECHVCRTTLYLSKVTGLVNKKSAFCPEHAVRLIEKRDLKASDGLAEVTVTEFVMVSDLTYAVELVAYRLKEDT